MFCPSFEYVTNRISSYRGNDSFVITLGSIHIDFNCTWGLPTNNRLFSFKVSNFLGVNVFNYFGFKGLDSGQNIDLVILVDDLVP